jgi:L-rhamnose mutarotase
MKNTPNLLKGAFREQKEHQLCTAKVPFRGFRGLLLVFYLSAFACTPKIEKTTSSIIEIVGNDSISVEKPEQFCQSEKIEASVYQWNNHTVLYGTFSDLSETEKQIAAAYPGAVIKIYAQPFYVFDRKNCENKTTADKWSHTIMTANLVADTTLQAEYMNYHTTQAEIFPEVANGFCNANFQQVLVFRNGRQLMLVISIPEGENLDELNLKTTENNPRVDEWNAIMAKYQEGIEGTKPGETWVVFN